MACQKKENECGGEEMSVFIVAEIGINHNGDLNLAKKLIDTATVAGCDAVKFQKRTVDKVYTKEYLDSPRQSPWGETQRAQKEGLECGTHFTSWNQTSFSYTFRNNLHGVAFRLKYSNWYGKAVCAVSSVKLKIQEKEYIMSQNKKQSFFISPDKDLYSDAVEQEISPCDITLTVEFADAKRPESGNTFSPGVVMIV